jgi:ABC-2 type transport system permease protein
MRKILAIIFKDIRLRFDAPAEWIFFLILPLVFTVVLAGGTGESDSRARLLVVDQAVSPLSQQLLKSLQDSQAVRVEQAGLDEAEASFSARSADALLLIPADFTAGQLQQGQGRLELRQLPGSTAALMAVQAVRAAADRTGGSVEIASSSVAEAESIRPFQDGAARTAYFDEALSAAEQELSQAPDRVKEVRGNTRETIEYDPRANSSAGQLITWVFVPLIGISGMFAYERQIGTLRRLLTTPTEKATFLIGTISGQVLIAIFQMLLLVGFGGLVLKVNWGQSPLALGVILLAEALAGASLGVALGSFVKTEAQANGLSMMLGMLMALLGGCWYPLDLFPGFVQQAVKILPTTWAMQGMLDIVARGQGLAGVLPTAGVLLGFAVVFFTVGVLRFRYE